MRLFIMDKQQKEMATAKANIATRKAEIKEYNFGSRKKAVRGGGGLINQTINFNMPLCDRYFESMPPQLQELIEYASVHGSDGSITVQALVDHTISMGKAFSANQVQDATHIISAYNGRFKKAYKGINLEDLSNLWTLTS